MIFISNFNAHRWNLRQNISILHWLLLIVYLLFFFGFYFEYCKKIPRNWKSIQLHFKRNVVRAFNFYVPNWIECMHYICSLMLMDQTRWIFDYVSALGVHMIFSEAHFFFQCFCCTFLCNFLRLKLIFTTMYCPFVLHQKRVFYKFNAYN